MKQKRTKKSGSIRIEKVRERFGKKKCANCGSILKGVLSLKVSKMKNIPKSKKKPSRKFGGYLCSECSRREIIRGVRK